MNTLFTVTGLGGEQTLKGSIPVFGSKNASLIAFPAALLFKDTVTIEHVPHIEDVRRMVELLKDIGVSIVKKDKHAYEVAPAEKVECTLPPEIVGRIRASVLLIGPLLGRFGKVTFNHPGGDSIGARPIDLALDGLQKMGASCSFEDGVYTLDTGGKKLAGADIFLRMPSVSATQILMLAAVLAGGTTTIANAAMEPEIKNIGDFLNKCGGAIFGVGTPTITIRGTGMCATGGKKLTIIPDRLETGSFLALGVLAGKDITITECEPKHVEIFIRILQDIASSDITVGKDSIRIQNTKPLVIQPIDIKTHEYPGFVTDMQSLFVVLLTQAAGKSLVFETIYEERFNYVGNVIHMGAKIITYDPHRVSVRGKTSLTGTVQTSPDIRAGLAYLLAAIIAKGDSVIHNVYVIDRGYEHIEERLRKIGVAITREEK